MARRRRRLFRIFSRDFSLVLIRHWHFGHIAANRRSGGRFWATFFFWPK